MPIPIGSGSVRAWRRPSGHATTSAALGPKMACRLPRKVIVVNEEQAPFAQHYGSLSIGRGYRSVATLRLRSGVSLACN